MEKQTIHDWIQIILGILLLVLGVLTFDNPHEVLTGIVIMYGMAAVFMGILDIVFFIKTEMYTGFGPTLSLISGILSIMAGFMLLVYPGAESWVMVLLLPIWFIAHCVFRLTQLNLVRLAAGSFYYYFTLTINILGISGRSLAWATPWIPSAGQSGQQWTRAARIGTMSRKSTS